MITKNGTIDDDNDEHLSCIAYKSSDYSDKTYNE